MLRFIGERRRHWSLIYFHSPGAANDAVDLITDSYGQLTQNQRAYFKSLIVLYSNEGWFRKLFNCSRHRGRNVPRPVNFSDLHTFIKEEKPKDFKFQQSLLSALPKENMQLYFHERNADKGYQPNPFGGNEAQDNAFSAMNQGAQKDCVQDDPFGEESCKTSDIFGKTLCQFKQRDGAKESDVPLIFWLVAGYFRTQEKKMETEGLFRVAAAESDVKELEIHLSQDNYYFLTTVENPHVVSNYLKKMMREMADPVCPYDQYDAYMVLANIPVERRVHKLSELVR